MDKKCDKKEERNNKSAPIMQLKPVYSMDELLEIIPIGRSSIYNQIKVGNLIASKMGRRTIFLAKDVYSWLEKLRLA